VDAPVTKTLASTEGSDFESNTDPHDFPSRTFDQCDGCTNRATRRQHVIHQQHLKEFERLNRQAEIKHRQPVDPLKTNRIDVYV
jgi:hypothetical protein